MTRKTGQPISVRHARGSALSRGPPRGWRRRARRRAGSPCTWETTLLGAERVDAEHWVAVQRLDGDFPGGTVELRYRTTLVKGLSHRPLSSLRRPTVAR